jgi:uncharacterized metal-binding protein YceD (DUF177 family)
MTDATRERAETPETPPELSRPVAVAKIRADDGFQIDIAATEAERDALARLLGVREISALTARIEARPWSAGGLCVEGVVRAALTQTCVVTLDPVPARIEERFRRYLAPPARVDEASELLDADVRDELEALGETIDFGAIATEQVALALDPYPRADGAALGAHVHGPPGAEPLTDEAARPFAGLAALRRDLEGGDSDGGDEN